MQKNCISPENRWESILHTLITFRWRQIGKKKTKKLVRTEQKKRKKLFPDPVRLRWHHPCQGDTAGLLMSVSLLRSCLGLFHLLCLINKRSECCHPFWCFNYPWLVCNKAWARAPFNQPSHGKRPPGCLVGLSSVAPPRGTCPFEFTSTRLIHPPSFSSVCLLFVTVNG